MRRLLPLLILLALTPVVRGQDAANADPDPGVLSHVTLTCSAAAPSGTLGCFAERPVLVLGPAELAVGVDAQAVLTADGSHLAPYAALGWYADTWAAWIEARLPELAAVPVLGDSDWLRVGFTYRWP